MLVHSGFAQSCGRELLAGVAHGDGEGARFLEREAANPRSHQPGGKLFHRDGAIRRAVGNECNLAVVERAAVDSERHAAASRGHARDRRDAGA